MPPGVHVVAGETSVLPVARTLCLPYRGALGISCSAIRIACASLPQGNEWQSTRLLVHDAVLLLLRNPFVERACQHLIKVRSGGSGSQGQATEVLFDKCSIIPGTAFASFVV